MLVIASVVGMWVIPLIIQPVRTWRFFGFLAVVGAATVFVAVAHPPQATLLRLLLVLSVVVVTLCAEWIGLGAMTRAERDLDARIDRITRETDGGPPRYAERAEAFDRLRRSAGPGIAPRWRTLLRLLRRSAFMSAEPRILHPDRPTEAFTYAAKRYQREMQRGRSVAGKHYIRPLDEETALSTYLDDFRNVVPKGTVVGDLVDLGAPWVGEAAAIVDELDSVRFADEQADGVRELLVTVLSLEYRQYSEDRSDEARLEYPDASARAKASWDAFALSLTDQSPPRTSGADPPRSRS